jgi:hypothetical protein
MSGGPTPVTRAGQVEDRAPELRVRLAGAHLAAAGEAAALLAGSHGGRYALEGGSTQLHLRHATRRAGAPGERLVKRLLPGSSLTGHRSFTRCALVSEKLRYAMLHRELAAGSLLQVNAWSLAGGSGAEAERRALWLVGSGVVICLASDAHPGWRGPALGVGLEKASWAVARARARILTDSAPRALLERGAPAPTPASQKTAAIRGGPRCCRPTVSDKCRQTTVI